MRRMCLLCVAMYCLALAGCTSPEERFWQEEGSKSVAGCTAYLSKYPHGPHTDDAQQVIDDDRLAQIKRQFNALNQERAALRKKGEFKQALSKAQAALQVLSSVEEGWRPEQIEPLKKEAESQLEECQGLAANPVKIDAEVNLSGHYLSSEVGATRWTGVKAGGTLTNRCPFPVKNVVVKLLIGSGSVLTVDTKTGQDVSHGGFSADDSIERTLCRDSPLGSGDSADFSFSGSIDVVTRLTSGSGSNFSFNDPTPGYDIVIVSYDKVD